MDGRSGRDYITSDLVVVLSYLLFVQPFHRYLIKVGLWGRGAGVGSLGSFVELDWSMYVYACRM